MTILFVNAAFRENSRTYALAQQYLSILTDEIETVNLGEEDIHPLQKASLEKYCKNSRNHDLVMRCIVMQSNLLKLMKL